MYKLQQKRQEYFQPSLTTPEGKKDVKVPKYYCKSCTKCVDKHCTFFNRPVEPSYNKCFNHSNYHNVAVRYQEPEHLRKIKEEYERRKIA